MPTALLTIAATGYAVAIRATRLTAESEPVDDPVALAFGPGMMAFIIAPAWLLLSCVWTRQSSHPSSRGREGSERAWFESQMRNAMGETSVVLVPLTVSTVVLVFSSPSPSITRWDEIVVRVVLAALFLLAARATLVATLSLTGRPGWMYAVAATIVVLGATLSAGRPLTAWDGLNWMTWAVPALSTEATGSAYLGLVVLPAWVVLTYTVVVVRERGGRGLRAVADHPIIWMTAFLVGIQVLFLRSFANVGPVGSTESFALIYQGPQVDGLGIPLVQTLFTFLVFFGPSLLMLHRMDDERGAWMRLILLRSGTSMVWVLRFAGRWIVLSVVLLLGAPMTTAIAWRILPDADRADDMGVADPWLLVVRYVVIGSLQVLLYVLVTFAAAWISGSPLVGVATLSALMIGGLTNPLFGGWVPGYLNGLSRALFGWDWVLRDMINLVVWIGVIGSSIVAFTRAAERRPQTERGAVCLSSSSTS